MRPPTQLWLATAATLAAACAPTTPPGLQCSATSQCPEGQQCATDGLCYADICSPGCGGDEICDYATLTCKPASSSADDPDADKRSMPADSRNHVGFVTGSSNRVLGTVVSPHVAITCSECLGTNTASQLSFVAGGLTVGVREITHHSSADVAALHLETVQASPSLQLADSAPMSGTSYTCIAPSPVDAQRFQYIVTVTSTDVETFEWSGIEIGGDMTCAMVGGPTFETVGTGDVLIGLHTRSACEGGVEEDLRVDLIRGWIQGQIEDATPDECPTSGTCSGDCGEWSCTEDGEVVIETCSPDSSKCGAGQSCSDSLVCEDDAACSADEVRVVQGTCGVQICSDGEWGPTQPSDTHCTDPSFPTCDSETLECICSAGQYLTCPGDGCGRRYCAVSSGDYHQCTAYSSTCDEYPDETCVQNGSTFTCERG